MPATVPSFFPSGSSSSTPTHIPSGLKSVGPMKRTSPFRPSLSWTSCPIEMCDIVGRGDVVRGYWVHLEDGRVILFTALDVNKRCGRNRGVCRGISWVP